MLRGRAAMCESLAGARFNVIHADSQAGQSASITATLAGQVVSEGFINWRTNVRTKLHLQRG